MKKQVALVTAIAMLSVSLYGCGAGSSMETTDNRGNSDVVEEVTPESSDTSEDAKENSSVNLADGMTAMSDTVLDETRQNTSTSDTRYSEVVIAVDMAPADLLPAGTNDAGKQQLQYEIYEALAARYEHDGEELWGVIAKSWEDVDDLHTIVTLYDNVHDSEGNAITASDVVFSYNLAIGSGLTTGFGVVENVEAVDDYTVEFTWSEELGVTDFANVMTECYIVSETAYDEDTFITQPIGTGPYCLSEYTAGVSYTLTPNENYWQPDESVLCPLGGRNVQSIRYDVISDKSQQIIAFESGGIDSVSLSADDLGEFTEGGEYYGKYALYFNPATNNTGILPNCSENSICSDINFRLAMYYAVDANAICEALGSGQFSAPVSDSFPGLYDYNEDWEKIDSYYNHYDVELAKEYLEKTDYNGETIVCLVDSDTDRDNCAVILQGFLKQIG
ncbi:MAG: ABC transporter substrate-binding protein, partial [Lachnospiraceae bacterium]|nr:ABC transporter substrate-binding protein [Lachnospiraceae bacterium]